MFKAEQSKCTDQFAQNDNISDSNKTESSDNSPGSSPSHNERIVESSIF